MKKFGFGKKGDKDDDSSRSKSKSPAPPNNPYAQPTAPLTAYDRAKISAGARPAPEAFDGGLPSNPRGGLPSGPKTGYGQPTTYPNAPAKGGNPGYGAPQAGAEGGYSSEKYGDQNGYGADKYGGNPYGGERGGNASRYGPGGYGGLGRTYSGETTATDDKRDELFGGARDRFEQKQSNPYGGGPPPYEEGSGANGGDYNGAGAERSYGAYGDRQLTAEEEEEEDIQGTKQEMKFLKQQDVSSTRNALRVAAQAEETGRNTLARLGAQGESIHNTEKNLDLAANHNRYADEKARELKTLNRSMFAVHMNNPFTGKQRRQQRDEAILTKHRDEREQREETRRQAFQTTQRMEQTFKEMDLGESGGPKSKASLADRAKYQFEADSEDDELENEIDNNLDLLSGAAGRLNALARATGREVEEQNRHLERIAGKSDFVDEQIAMNRAKLDRIK
ncbi:putative plasma membrane snare protein [Phaeomoniella chlamydospora]|uniref:Protein transport protein SEC9 n=1 Tax=Phaeomoniella chlamydospora TaxID=158046 RepID=A0A0G2H8I2_PHACM|nr:putative plasma membrane snare protein [Phaeomoniella chlamydospora]